MPNVTNTAGGRIGGRIALTFEALAALEVDQPVHVSGDYRVAIADGSKPIVGYVDIANKKRVGGTFPSAETPGTVTVEARGVAVRPLTVGATPVVAGTTVGVNSAGLLAPAGTGVSNVGIALMSGSTPAKVDVLIQAS